MADYSSKFKNSNGQLYTKRLFFEQCQLVNDRSSCLYTLKDEDHTVNGETYISLYKRYLEMEDVSEYRFANHFFESYEHFRMTTLCDWFKPHIERWRNELRLKIRSEAIDNIRDVAKDKADKNSFDANKLILNGFLNLEGPVKKGHSRGRPSKEEVSKAVKEMAKEDYQVNSDFDRITSGSN